MSEETKYIPIKELREQGYVQEVNRRFFHPLGLALAIKIDEDGNESLAGVIDVREDVDGMYFDLANSDDERKQKAIRNFHAIQEQIKQRQENRIENLGFFIEPVE